jgi:hypothetical protein
MIPAFERAKTFHALDRAATVIDNYFDTNVKLIFCHLSIKIANVTEEYIAYILIPDDRERRLLRTAGKDLSDHTVSHLRRQ